MTNNPTSPSAVWAVVVFLLGLMALPVRRGRLLRAMHWHLWRLECADKRVATFCKPHKYLDNGRAVREPWAVLRKLGVRRRLSRGYVPREY